MLILNFDFGRRAFGFQSKDLLLEPALLVLPGELEVLEVLLSKHQVFIIIPEEIEILLLRVRIQGLVNDAVLRWLGEPLSPELLLDDCET